MKIEEPGVRLDVEVPVVGSVGDAGDLRRET